MAIEQNAPAAKGTEKLSTAEQRALKNFIERKGILGAVKHLRVSRSTLLAAAAGCGIRRANKEMVVRGLRELAGAQGVEP